MTIAFVFAWSAIPIGALVGGALVERTGNIKLIYGGIGILTFLIPLVFSFTALGKAERYMPKGEDSEVDAGTW
ncbi:hypothetical protein EI42_06242 [Thermosporothrix hazakensis]|jgi:hypothetical protein|uniref:MFS transporter n=1 Tax=Thermosporothrix hazakensis TaxID=644383 RepID=A0A326TS02_THEHA|nr:hypothetical protein [Thermosporothrix hazakensis]PZW18325.1 hypothetical protein EI42_06242 [Thermosporothrix hazakensis]GCE51454.1 hypothetical protein KTH_63230 [Thermosporothrix hazakensis]